MQEFAKTQNGRRFLRDVEHIAGALKKIADYLQLQATKEQDELWERLGKEDPYVYSTLKTIQEAEKPAFFGAEAWNRMLLDYLRRLRIPYFTWTHFVISTSGEVLDLGHTGIAGRPPKIGDFEEPEEAALDAALKTMEMVTW